MEIHTLTWAAIGLCIVLAAFVFILYRRLTLMKQREKDQLKARAAHWHESARIVALAVVQDQCDLSEGCLRLRYILGQLNISKDVLERMGDELAPFATHNVRNELPISERFKQDQMRAMIEEKYQEELLELCREVAATHDFREA